MAIIYKLEERLEIIDKCINNYKSITEFRKAHPKLYWYINYHKIKKYDNYFIPQKFSSQQMICKQLTEKLFNLKCMYNTRKILNGKELDIYFPDFNIAFEYDSYYWHINRKSEDNDKKLSCNFKDILLIQIVEKYNNHHSNVKAAILDIKTQIKSNLKLINGKLKIHLTEKDVDNLEIDEKNLLNDMFGKDDIEYVINNCDRYSEVKTKYNKIWQYLSRNKMLHVLEPIKRRDYIYMSKEETLNYIKCNFLTYSDFVKHKIYQLCRKRGYLDDVKLLY